MVHLVVWTDGTATIGMVIQPTRCVHPLGFIQTLITRAAQIGTYSVAVLASRHNIPFVVVAPVSTVDVETRDGTR